MRKLFKLAIIIIALIIILPKDAHAAQSNKGRYNLSLSGSDVIAAINGYRQQNGIAPLTPNALLNSLAQWSGRNYPSRKGYCCRLRRWKLFLLIRNYLWWI